jgi:2-dehydro-3-deoxygluconokinase
MTLRTDGRIVAFGEIMIRLTAPGAEILLQTPRLDVTFGGAEANVAVALARLGHDTRMVSFVPDNALGRATIDEIRRHGVDCEGMRLATGRMGLYFLTQGAGPRAPEVLYDRANSAFALADPEAVDWARELDGAGWLHLSGVTAAIGKKSSQAAIRCAQEARRLGVTLSFDCNYRAKLWQAWKGDGRKILSEIIGQADVVFGDHRDIGLILGRDFPTEGGEAADAAFAAFPNLQRLAATRRVQTSADRQDLSAVMHARDASWEAPAMSLTQIVDRIGAGDAFAAGLIHGLRRKLGDEHALKFALATACLKHVTPGDFSLARVEDVEALLSGAGVSVRR